MAGVLVTYFKGFSEPKNALNSWSISPRRLLLDDFRGVQQLDCERTMIDLSFRTNGWISSVLHEFNKLDINESLD
jgi:hypothetical protein